jgi:hypothetical protein
MRRSGPAVDAPTRKQHSAAAAGGSRGDPIVVNERRRCGWGAVLAAVTLFATLLLTVPTGPGPV